MATNADNDVPLASDKNPSSRGSAAHRKACGAQPAARKAPRPNAAPPTARTGSSRSRLPEPSPVPRLPDRGIKAATFTLLLDTAMQIIREAGHVPSIAEVAVRAKVSRATTYRYFPSRSALITAVVERSLGPVRAFASTTPGGRERVRELFEQSLPRFIEFEPQMRAAMQLSLEQWALQRAGLLEEEHYRRGHRIRILSHALAPFDLPPRTQTRLHQALSVIFGMEPMLVLKDMWNLPDREAHRVTQWMADALIDAALREGQGAGRRTSRRESDAPASKTRKRPS